MQKYVFSKLYYFHNVLYWQDADQSLHAFALSLRSYQDRLISYTCICLRSCKNIMVDLTKVNLWIIFMLSKVFIIIGNIMCFIYLISNKTCKLLLNLNNLWIDIEIHMVNMSMIWKITLVYFYLICKIIFFQCCVDWLFMKYNLLHTNDS